MLLLEQLGTYYPELSDERLPAIAFVHQFRPTFPTWDLAQPSALSPTMVKSTLRGNSNRMSARTALFNHPDLGDGVKDLHPWPEGASDTAVLITLEPWLCGAAIGLTHWQ